MYIDRNTLENLRPKVIYAGIFLDDNSQQILFERFKPKYKNIYAHHLTIAYKPSDQVLLNLDLGLRVELSIIGLVEDDKCQVLIVDTEYSGNKIPHITLSTGEGVAPVYSNSLVEKQEYKKFSTPVLNVIGTIGLFMNDQSVYFGK